MSNNNLSLKELKHEQHLRKWIPIINSCVNSGLSKQEWCKQNGINIKSYFYWQKRIFDASVGSSVEFAECGHTMTEIGKEVKRSLKIIPAKAVVVEDWYYTYACDNCKKNDIEVPIACRFPKHQSI